MDETPATEVQSSENINMEESLIPKEAFDAIEKKIDENLRKLSEKISSNDARGIETFTASTALWEAKKAEYENQVGRLFEMMDGGTEIEKALLNADIIILNGRLSKIDGYLKACELATSGRYYTEQPAFEESPVNPLIRGVSFETYQEWLTQNQHILEQNHDEATIALFQKTITLYEKDLQEIETTITGLEDSLYVIPDEEPTRPTPHNDDVHFLLQSNIELLNSMRLDIEQYLGTYRKAVQKHQEEALSI